MEENKIISNSTKSHILQLKKAIRNNKLVIFAGAGVSKSAGIPLWGELINELRKELDLPQSEVDYLKIPQIYKNMRKEKEYLERIKEILLDGQKSPNHIHNALLDLNPCHIVTTNYDDLFEQAMISRNENFFTVSRDEDLPYNQGERLLIKMHGDFKSGKIVLTENDYLDYARDYPLIRAYVMSLFASKVVLFVGFSYSDINLKYIIRDVRSCLGDKMQPIYMLSNGEDNGHVLNYFDSNYIHLVQLKKEEVDGTLKEIRVNLESTSFDDDRSMLLYKQLGLIRNYNEYNNDFFGLLVNFLSENIDQFLYLGKYIKHIFPKQYQREVRVSYNELTLPDVYKESALAVFGNSKEAEEFRKKNKDDFAKVVVWLNSNGVRVISDVANLSSFADQIKLENAEVHPLVHIQNLDIKEISKSLEKYSNRPLSYSKDDLIYPFMLCKLGRYKEAYDCYKRLSLAMTSKNKYVLSFICKYNMRSLYGPVLNEKMGWDFEQWQQLNKEMSKIDVIDILNNMPIHGVMRTILLELANGKYLSDRVADTTDFYQKLQEQRESSERGGSSLNNNINHVLWSLYDLIDFEYNNSIFNEPFSYFKRIHQKTIEGILHSILTVDKDFHQTKMQCLSGDIAPLFVFYASPSDLGKSLKKVVGDKRLPFDETFNSQLIKWLENIYVANDKGRVKNTCVSRSLIGEYLLNILWIAVYTDKPLDLPHIHELVADYWFDGKMLTHEKLFERFFLTYEPSPIEAISHLENILHTNISYAERLETAVYYLCCAARKGDLTLNELISVKQIAPSHHIQYKASFCKVATDDVRKELIQHLQESAQSLYQLVEAEMFSEAGLITVQKVQELENVIEVKSDNNLFAEASVFANLVRMIKKPEYAFLASVIEECFKDNMCYKFFKNPVLYEGAISDTDGSWYLFVEDDVLKVLIENPLARHIIRQFCDKHPWANDLKDKVWGMM